MKQHLPCTGLQDKVDEGQAKVAVQAALCGTCRAWSLWAVMLHWVHFAAGVVDSGQPSKCPPSVWHAACGAVCELCLPLRFAA